MQTFARPHPGCLLLSRTNLRNFRASKLEGSPNSLEQVPKRATVVLQRPTTGPSLLVHPLMKFGKQNRLLRHLPRHWGCNGTGAPEVSQEQARAIL